MCSSLFQLFYATWISKLKRNSILHNKVINMSTVSKKCLPRIVLSFSKPLENLKKETFKKPGKNVRKGKNV